MNAYDNVAQASMLGIPYTPKLLGLENFRIPSLDFSLIYSIFLSSEQVKGCSSSELKVEKLP